ncbi:MAG: 4-alpha-glucanotransferase [Salinispira sp.]
MNIHNSPDRLSGILIPLFSLRSPESPGCGDFLSLIELGRWCVEAGVDIIQLLPVNDSGTDPSPYSALSAYALHPLYLRMSALPEYGALSGAEKTALEPAMGRLREYDTGERFSYRNVLDCKQKILTDVFQCRTKAIVENTDFQHWIDMNCWVMEYSVFRSIKAEHESRSWLEWEHHRNPSEEEIEELWQAERYRESNRFFAWLQYRLEQQFLEAAGALRELGIALKGDIPILMNDDSVDVWARREFFHCDLRAGAPPDMFSKRGQNWGFPIYNWEALKERGYGWWKLRLRQAAKFYSAYRIDHVLGFFRIWTIHQSHTAGALGYFAPACYISRQELHEIGFDDARIQWLAEPHVRREQLEHALGDALRGRTDDVISVCFRQLPGENMYLFTEDIQGEKSILALPFDDEIKQALLEMYWDRALICVGTDQFSAAWHFHSCSRYSALSEGEKTAFERIVAEKQSENERLWEGRGEELLAFIRKEVDVLCCAEDLGAVPDCVPGVLDRLGILGLKIPRWERRGKTFIPPEQYPVNTVCAPSVHDTSTLREWWEYGDGHEDAHKNSREAFWEMLYPGDPCPEEYSPETAERVIRRLLDVRSKIIVFQIQDIFALDQNYHVDDSRTERMNIPGTVQAGNWSYRLPMSIQELRRNAVFTVKIRSLLAGRAAAGAEKRQA